MKVNPSTKSSSNVNMDKFKTTGIWSKFSNYNLVLGNKIPEQKPRYCKDLLVKMIKFSNCDEP